MKIVLPQNNAPLWFFNILQVGLVLSLSGAALGYHTLNSIGVWAIFFSVLGLSIFEVAHNNGNAYYAFAILIIILIAFLSMTYSNNITYKGFVSLFSFLEIPLLIIFTKPIDSDKRIRSACFFAVLISAIYIYAYFSPRSHYFLTVYGERTLDDLTLGFSNPNETGMHLVSCFSVLICCIFFIKKKIVRILLMIDSVVIFSFIVQSLSRMSIIVSIALIAFLIPVIRCKQISKAVQRICFYSPFLTFLVSMVFPRLIASYTLFGQTLDTGRIELYYERFTGMDIYGWLIGDYSYLFQNSLNAYLSVYLTIGLLSLIVFLIILKYGIKTCYLSAKTSYNKVAFLALLLFIVHASVESANLVGGSFYAASFFSIYVIAIDDSNKKSKNCCDKENIQLKESNKCMENC